MSDRRESRLKSRTVCIPGRQDHLHREFQSHQRGVFNHRDGGHFQYEITPTKAVRNTIQRGTVDFNS